MSRGILPCVEYFEKIKECRRLDIGKYKQIGTQSLYQIHFRQTVLTGIGELNNTMKRYILARERCIKGKIILFCMCLGMFDVRVPTEMWIKILSFTDFVI